MLLILVAFGPLVGHVAEPTLSAVLIVAAVGAFRFKAMATVFRTGLASQIAMMTTLLSTLFLPVQAAVGIGVALSILLQLNREALDLRIVELRPTADGRLAEFSGPIRLESRHITALDVYGSLYYAGARTLQVRLPDPAGLDRPVVIIRLRGRTTLGSTSIVVLADYADRLDQVSGRLYLTGVDPTLVELFRRTGRLKLDAAVRVFTADPVLGESSQAAFKDAEAWLAAEA
jgi:SulP family sulfate permease